MSINTPSTAHRHGSTSPIIALQPGAYETKASLELAAGAAAKGAGAGLLVSAVQNALDSHKRGAVGVVTRTGGTVGLFGECEFTTLSGGRIEGLLLPAY